MNKLSIKYKNITFENPFILASSPITRNAEMIMRGFESGWAGAVTKTICLDSESINNVKPRLQGFKANSKLIGLNNIELISERSIENWISEISLIKSRFPHKVLIASIMASAFNLEEWQKLACLVQEAGADIIELNLSCPHGMPERKMGSFCSEFSGISASIIEAVKKVSNIPVWAKLSPNVSDITGLSTICLEAGLDGIVAINTIKGFSGIDIDTLNPKLNIDGNSAYGGFSGQFVKPFALRAVSEIANTHNCFISASGGITNWQDAVEFMLLGSSTLQICTEVMFNGYDIINKLTTGLEEYLTKHNFNSIESIIGKSLNKIKTFNELNKDVSCVATILPECKACGKCYIACRDGAYQAIECVSGSYVINKDRCEGCGLCSIVCPHNGIAFNKVKKTDSNTCIASKEV